MRFRSMRSRAIAAMFIFAAAGLLRSSAFAADQALIDAARREGQVTWYTTQNIDQLARPTADAFQKRYGIPVNFTRGNSTTVALRVFNEHQAGRSLADVIDSSTLIPVIKRQGLLMKWLPDGVTRLLKEASDSDAYWVATNEYFHTPAFNTNLVPRGTEPKTYEDLLDPKWKGKMAWAKHVDTSGGLWLRRHRADYDGRERGHVLSAQSGGAGDHRARLVGALSGGSGHRRRISDRPASLQSSARDQRGAGSSGRLDPDSDPRHGDILR